MPIEAIIDPELNQNYSPRRVEGCLFVGRFQHPGKKKASSGIIPELEFPPSELAASLN